MRHFLLIYFWITIYFSIVAFSSQAVQAQELLSEGQMNAIQSLEQVLMVGADMDTFIQDKLETSYRASMSREAMKDYLRDIIKAVYRAQALDIEAEPGVIFLVFSEGASARVGVRFAPENPDKIQHIRLVPEKAPEEMTASEKFASARRKRMKAIEAIGNKSTDQQLNAFLEEHVNPSYIQTINREELLASLRTLQKTIARAGIIQFENTDEGSRLAFRGPENADVLFKLDPEEPHLITSLLIDTNVESNEENESVTLSPISWGNLEERLSEESEEGFSGAVIAVQEGQMVLKEGYGYANRESRRLNETSTIFGIGSIPIDFTIAAILKLEDEGALSLSDPIQSFFPEAPSDKASITLSQLIYGRSGLPNFHHNPEVDTDFDLAWVDREEALQRIFNQPLLFTPGEQQSHSHSAFVLLAAVIEQTTGSTYSDYLRTSFFIPMNMNHTGFYGENDQFDAEQFAIGYGYHNAAEPNIPLNWGPTSWLVMGSGGMFSTVEDLYTWISEIRSGTYLSASAIEKYGQGGVASGTSDRGFMATYIRDPQNTIIYLTNSHASDGDLSMGLGEALVRMVLTQHRN